MYRLTVKQCYVEGIGGYYEYEFKDLTDNTIIEKDSIDDIGQGMDKAVAQIRNILRRKGFIQ